jgi:hypothetical protein
MGENNLLDPFLRDIPSNLLILLLDSEEENYCLSLSKKLKCSNLHLSKILKHMRKNNLIYLNKNGRISLINLTKKGVYVPNIIKNMKTAPV